MQSRLRPSVVSQRSFVFAAVTWPNVMITKSKEWLKPGGIRTCASRLSWESGAGAESVRETIHIQCRSSRPQGPTLGVSLPSVVYALRRQVKWMGYLSTLTWVVLPRPSRNHDLL